MKKLNSFSKFVLFNLAFVGANFAQAETLSERVTALETRVTAIEKRLEPPQACLTLVEGILIANTTRVLKFDSATDSWIVDGAYSAFAESGDLQVLKRITDSKGNKVLAIRTRNCKIHFVLEKEVILY